MEGDKNLIGVMTEEEKAALIQRVLDKQKTQEQEINKLKEEIARKNKVIEVLATEGIDTSEVEPLTVAAPYIGKTGEALTELLENNEDEYLKTIFRAFHDTMAVKQKSFIDEELTPEGEYMIEKLGEAVNYLCQHPALKTYSAEDVDEYSEKVEELRTSYNKLLKWKKKDGDVMGLDEAMVDLIMHYGLKRMLKGAKFAVKKAEPELEKEIDAPKPPKPQPQPTPQPTNAAPESVEVKSKLEEQEKKLHEQDKKLLEQAKKAEEQEKKVGLLDKTLAALVKTYPQHAAKQQK